MKADSILATIGNTPHIRLSRMFPDHEVWVKCERANPGGSIKDRIGLAMIEAAEKDGSLKPGGTIVEPTSGNTGHGLAIAAALRGYRCIFVMPDKMSQEKISMLRAYGAEVIECPTAVPPEHPDSYYSVSDRLGPDPVRRGLLGLLLLLAPKPHLVVLALWLAVRRPRDAVAALPPRRAAHRVARAGPSLAPDLAGVLPGVADLQLAEPGRRRRRLPHAHPLLCRGRRHCVGHDPGPRRRHRRGLNLTWEVRDGIGRHSKGKNGSPVGLDPRVRLLADLACSQVFVAFVALVWARAGAGEHEACA